MTSVSTKKVVAKPAKVAMKSGISIKSHEKFPLVPLDSIHIVPKTTEDRLFCNARGDDCFAVEKLQNLIYSIRCEGLLKPLTGRPIGSKTCITHVELIAGERRTRSIQEIVVQNLPCFDEDQTKPQLFEAGDVVIVKKRFGIVETQVGKNVIVSLESVNGLVEETVDCLYADVYPTRPGSEVFEYVHMKLIADCSDERALGINWEENDTGEPLSSRDEVGLIERLVEKGMKQEAIAEMLNSNITFVSQTASFREQLPSQAFEKLLEGTMSRHMAVHMLSFPQEKRLEYFEGMQAEEQRQTSIAISKFKDEEEQSKDEAEIYEEEANLAETNGNLVEAAKLRKKAASAKLKASKAAERKARAQNDKGIIKQGHATKAAAKLGLKPRKAKMLPREQIEELYITNMIDFSTRKMRDPVTAQEVPNEMACIVRRTAQAILDGEYDALSVIRDYMVSNGRWTLPEEVQQSVKLKAAKPKVVAEDKDDDDEDDDESSGEDLEFDPELDEFDPDDDFDPEAELGFDPNE